MSNNRRESEREALSERLAILKDIRRKGYANIIGMSTYTGVAGGFILSLGGSYVLGNVNHIVLLFIAGDFIGCLTPLIPIHIIEKIRDNTDAKKTKIENRLKLVK